MIGKPDTAQERLIVALDTDNIEKAKAFIEKLIGKVKVFKVGSELFTACGPEIVRFINSKGAKVFLDLKFNDIPNTVARAVRVATRLNVFMFNVHIQGGIRMMEKAVAAAEEEAKALKIQRPVIIGVTQLTSMNQKDLAEIRIEKPMRDQVLHLAKLAQKSGLDGVVCSANEAKVVSWACGKDFLIVTPGIRPEWARAFDQKRVATPKEAVQLGADYIVVGRPIIEAQDPADAAQKIIDEMKG